MLMLDTSAGQQRPTTLLGRGAHWLRTRRWFVLFVILPTIVTALYYGLFAADVYVSESRFVVKAPNQRSSQSSTLASLIQTTGLSGGQEQTNEILDYIRSRDAMAELSKRTALRARFMSSEADALSRYPMPFTADRVENLFKYYRKMIDAQLDHDTGLAILRVKGFTPDDAYTLNARLLDLSETLVNRLNNRAQDKAIAEAERRVASAQVRLRTARIALGQYRNDQALLDPAAQGSGVLDISNRLIAEQAALRAQLQGIERLAPRNPAIPALRGRIAAIGTQIARQTGRAVGTSTGIASKLSGYENLAVEQEFATQLVTAANASLEQARTEAQKQQFYLERVVEPHRPDLALLPQRFINILIVFATCLCLYLIGWMLIVGILEHAPED
jgi:capsular polysaccharide transport system permease protein